MNIDSRLKSLEAVLKNDPPRCATCGSKSFYVVATSDSDTTRCGLCGSARPSDTRQGALKVYLDVDLAAV